ncbi:hypothetical protein N7517_007640 [Penicillium concentricum]|uniref:Zn(2)-C6 fungal-type domain-containing protein n=1 Tax=Penicillium concentricum TaxID=293559 RepID=A0A9W9SE96_9EURO|nr:uncharacterized protein N7517_007640 [Penicillium concentricum]KAJ5375634.1 hypothetical protein N7517_007640 [Penicillium concentricum]
MSTRSHQGCWTCKHRRRRCDNARPTCRNCAKRGVDCEGYEVRLRWGSGVASRGRFTGADKPLEENVPPRQLGRRRDLSRERKRLEAQAQTQRENGCDDMLTQMENDATLTIRRSEKDEILFNESPESMLQPRLPGLCEESNALYDICLTLQLSLSTIRTLQFFEYFDTSLQEFRSELARSTTLSDGTLTAGLLLCSIGVSDLKYFYFQTPSELEQLTYPLLAQLMQGLPWTMHIEGMYNILQIRSPEHSTGMEAATPFRTHLLEVMGVMDIPCFAIGRQTSPIGIWRRFCQSTGPRHGIEPVTGLPRSLLNLLAGIDTDTTEQSFWDWAGEAGTFSQCHLWEAYRLAGILTIHQRRRSSGSPQSHSTRRRSELCPADPSILVARIVANVDALRLGCLERPEENYLNNSIIFPNFVAGLEVDVMRQNLEWQEAIRRCSSGTRQDDMLLEILQELWLLDDSTLDINDLARARGVEMGLL